MKYVNSSGTLCVSSEKSTKFLNFTSAVMALNAIQLYYAQMGFNVHSSICKDTKRVELSIHFDSFDFPVLLRGYLFTRRQITSHSYAGYNAKPCERCRVVTYYFEF